MFTEYRIQTYQHKKLSWGMFRYQISSRNKHSKLHSECINTILTFKSRDENKNHNPFKRNNNHIQGFGHIHAIAKQQSFHHTIRNIAMRKRLTNKASSEWAMLCNMVISHQTRGRLRQFGHTPDHKWVMLLTRNNRNWDPHSDYWPLQEF